MAGIDTVTVTSQTKVLPGHKIVVTDDSLPEGAEVTVTVSVNPKKRLSAKEAYDLILSMPPSGRTLEEVKEYIRQERDSWE